MYGSQTTLSEFTKGATIGKNGLIDMNSKRSATAKVIKVPKILVLSTKSFRDIIEKYSKDAIKALTSIACTLALRLRHTIGRFAVIFK